MMNKNERMEILSGKGIDTSKYFNFNLPDGLKPGATISLVINENGEPDIDKFIAYGKQAVSLYQPYLGNIVDERNAAATQSDDEPTRGGR